VRITDVVRGRGARLRPRVRGFKLLTLDWPIAPCERWFVAGVRVGGRGVISRTRVIRSCDRHSL
jgi:hypothetical protein